MPNKIEVARLLTERLPWLNATIGTAIWWLVVALAAYRLTSVIRRGAAGIDLFIVPLGLALIGDLILQRWLYDHVTWMGAGIGLIAGAIVTRSSKERMPS